MANINAQQGMVKALEFDLSGLSKLWFRAELVLSET